MCRSEQQKLFIFYWLNIIGWETKDATAVNGPGAAQTNIFSVWSCKTGKRNASLFVYFWMVSGHSETISNI